MIEGSDKKKQQTTETLFGESLIPEERSLQTFTGLSSMFPVEDRPHAQDISPSLLLHLKYNRESEVTGI